MQARMLACERASSYVQAQAYILLQVTYERARTRKRAACGQRRSVAARMRAAGSRAGEQMARRGGSRASGRRGTSARVRAGGEAQQLQVLMFACRQATTVLVEILL